MLLEDVLNGSRNQNFSTYDRGSQTGCAAAFGVGWWFGSNCTEMVGNFTGEPKNESQLVGAIMTVAWKDASLKGISLLIRETGYVGGNNFFQKSLFGKLSQFQAYARIQHSVD